MDNFVPHLTFRLERQVIRDGYAVKAWLEAHLHQWGITWVISEQFWLGSQDLGPVRGPYVREVYRTNLGSRPHDKVLLGRIESSRSDLIMEAIRGSMSDHAAMALMVVFRNVYYPGEVEDEHNGWIRVHFPELHEEEIRLYRMVNQRTVADVLNS